MKRLLALVSVLVLAGCSSGSSSGPSLTFEDVTPGDVSLSEDAPAGADVVAGEDLVLGPDACVASCEGRVCGDDGCGGSCGSCAAGEFCAEDGRCYCAGCQDRQCGLDPCSGLMCGMCPGGMECSAEGECYVPCVPECGDRCCGDDGCGGECPNFCGTFGVDCDPTTCHCEPFSACGQETEPPVCETVGEAPSGWDEVKTFLRTNAVPLRCSVEEQNWWDFSILEQEFADKRIFMFGEVHGSQELGPMSGAIFAHLVRAGMIDSFSIEIGVDTTAPINEYVRTGGGPLLTDYYFDHWPNKMMWRELVEVARALYLEGYEVTAFGCDTPMRLAYVNEQIEAIAAGLTETKGLVLDSLPQPGPAVWQEVSRDYLDDADAYSEHIQANIDAICEELGDEIVCERLLIMAETVWLGAFSMYSGTHSVSDQAFYEFLYRREPLIYFSYRDNMRDGQRVYTHMGAFHTAKAVNPQYSYESTGTLLNDAWEPTRGLVYATTPNYGTGSRIYYGGEIMQVPPDPSVVAHALEEEENDRYYVSLVQPGADCRLTPLYDETSSATGTPLGETYDVMMFVRQLTPQSSGFKATLPRPIQAALAHLDAVRTAQSRLRRRAVR